MKTLLITAVLCLLLATTYGCETASDTTEAGADALDDSATSGCAVAPTLASLQKALFQPQCGFGSCHGRPPNGGPSKGNLDLSPAVAWENLVGQPANNAAAAARGKVRVVVGDPMASFLVQKLRGTHQSDEGALMPKGRPVPLGDECALSAVEAWIQAGAER